MSDLGALLDIENLKTRFHTEEGTIEAVDGISLRIGAGRTLGLVGESGSGKSVTSLSIMRLLDRTARIEADRIAFLGQELVGLPELRMRQLRGRDMSLIFQEPMTSLNPVFSVGQQIMEALRLHQRISRRQARTRTIELLKEVGIERPAQRVDAYPHQLSGGQKQRVMIAMALSCNPQLLIADEPTTALDVTIQAQILEILRRLRDQRRMAMLFITHDLGVIAEIADEVAVMLRGKIVESGSVEDIFRQPQHPYTQGLLACRPRLDSTYKRLPTVQQYVELHPDGDSSRMLAKTPTPEQLERFTNHGRGRLLHPRSELAAMGHPWEEGHHPPATETVEEGTEPLLRVADLKVHFPLHAGLFGTAADRVKAVDGISLTIYRGQTLGLVGESGCGKTTTGRAILRLVEPTAGTVVYDRLDLGRLQGRRLRDLRRRMQIVFQDPYGSLNPRQTIEATLLEPMRIQRIGTWSADRRERAAALLKEVGLSPDHLRRYPHEFSGGQRQRICIARALTVEPEFVILDESVSALDVSVQAQVLNLLKDLQEAHQLTYIFISHDLSVVKFMADMMAVMQAGRIVEFGPSENIYAEPKQDYTRRLIEATPKDDWEHLQQRQRKRRPPGD